MELGEADELMTSRTTQLRTREGTIMGTAAYMSPEQAEGKSVDVRSDVFSFGVVLYEILTGRRPFRGDSLASLQASILKDEPRFGENDAAITTDLKRIVSQCLEKNKEARYGSASEVLNDLEVAAVPGERRGSKTLIAAVAGLALILAAGAWFSNRSQRIDWARNVATPEISRLSESGAFVPAFLLAQEALSILPQDRALLQLRSELSAKPAVSSEPSGATVYWKSYLDVDGDWREVGVTPFEDTAFPYAYLRWSFVKEGYRDKEVAAFGGVTLSVSMVRESNATDEMVRLPAAPTELASGETLNLDAFWLDRHEVTNAEYKKFVDASGYEQPEYWKHRFVDGSQTFTWEQAMTRWRDRTGRPGPSTWELGSYPEGQDSYPVQGVSWYEAAAYAEYVGKSLPTVYHWSHAALGRPAAATSTRLANLLGTSAVPVGTTGALDPFGTGDLAGNVKEWCHQRHRREPLHCWGKLGGPGVFVHDGCRVSLTVRKASDPRFPLCQIRGPDYG